MNPTNLQLTDTLLVYDIEATEYGDTPPKGTSNSIPALIEDEAGMAYNDAADVNTGTLTVFIAPDNAFYTEKTGGLVGLLAQFNRYQQPNDGNWYRIISVRPGLSLLTATPDLVQLTLTKVAKQNG